MEQPDSAGQIGLADLDSFFKFGWVLSRWRCIHFGDRKKFTLNIEELFQVNGTLSKKKPTLSTVIPKSRTRLGFCVRVRFALGYGLFECAA